MTNIDAYISRLKSGYKPDLNDLIQTFGVFVPSLHLLVSTPQDSEWHAEGDVHIHTQMVLDELYKEFETTDKALSGETQMELILGALFHDLAKPFTTKCVEIKGRERVCAPRHEPKGRSVLATALVDEGLPWKSLWNIMAMVGSHHEPKHLVIKDRDPGEYLRVSRRVNPEHVSFLERADLNGRVCPDKKEQLDMIALYEMGSNEYAPSKWQDHWKNYFQDVLENSSKSRRDRIFGEAVRLLESGKINSPEEAKFLTYQEPVEPPELVVLCGPSGSGKSSFVENVLKKQEWYHEVVSLDGIREELTGHRTDNSMKGEVIQEAKLRLKTGLRPGKRIVWDATNIRKDHREQICQTGFDYKALVTLIVFQETSNDYSIRNQKRSYAIPKSSLQSQIENWEWPEVDEAHRVIIMNGDGKVRGTFGMCSDELPWELKYAD